MFKLKKHFTNIISVYSFFSRGFVGLYITTNSDLISHTSSGGGPEMIRVRSTPQKDAIRVPHIPGMLRTVMHLCTVIHIRI